MLTHLAALPRGALLAHLRARACLIRQRDLLTIHRAGLGHPGGDLSCADILATLYGAVLRVDPRRPDWPERDRFILSKGHASVALYTTLAYAGFFPLEELDTFAQPGSRLNGHPNRKVPGVEANTGPLGHGLPIAVGCALAAERTGATWRTIVLCGDGELQEGSNWEALMAAAHHGLGNLTLVVDRNGLQLGAPTEATLALAPLRDKIAAFGWGVREVDGHDPGALLDDLSATNLAAGQPTCLIAHTHKGQGVSFMRDNPAWHHRVPTAAELAAALRELRGAEGGAA
jgi:transketolase